MKFIKKIIYTSCFITFLSCSKNEAEVKTDLLSLKKTIQMDFEPISALWRISKTSQDNFVEFGPIDYDFKAILKLTKSDSQKLKEQYSGIKKLTADPISLDFIEDWYTEGVKKCFSKTDNYVIVNKDVFPATKFGKFSFKHGYLFFTDDDEIFIYLYTT